ncbi:MAG: adenosine deaminase [Acidimicrobiia bacterium]
MPDLLRLPKVVLHDHLDGGVRPQTMIDLAPAVGYRDLPSTDPDLLKQALFQGEAKSLEEYLAAFRHTFGVMQTPEAMRRVAFESVEDLAAEGVVYAEIRFAPSLHLRAGMTRGEAIAAVLEGFAAAEQAFGVPARAIIDVMRQDSDSTDVAAAAVEFVGRGVVAIDLAGPEEGNPAAGHSRAIELGRSGGLHVTIHAGEGAGVDSIAGALAIGAERIGHGARIIEDTKCDSGDIVAMGEVATEVHDRRIPLELCPTSNLHTKMYPTAADHPFGALYRAGFVTTLNTDNRLMSGIDMTHEFEVIEQHHGFEEKDFRRVTLAAVDAAFCDEETRERVRARVEAGYQ